jgi:hypothetical protein
MIGAIKPANGMPMFELYTHKAQPIMQTIVAATDRKPPTRRAHRKIRIVFRSSEIARQINPLLRD